MSARPPEAVLWDFLRGAMMTRALAIVSELGIPAALSGGSRSVDDIAAEAGVDAERLYRILRALASDGVFVEHEQRVFGNTPTSEALRDEAWTSFAHLFGGVFYRAVADLDRAVREGTSSFDETFGCDLWAFLAQNPDERREFDRAMAGGKERSADRIAGLAWRDGEVVVDLGGGNGALLKGLLRRRPRLRGIVFDLPETNRDEPTFPEHLEFASGSFFDNVPAADTYVLAGVLHDWSDERAAEILRVVRAAARSGARLLVLESVISPGNEDPDGAKWLDLLMLVISGRERTAEEWRTLVEAGGFTVNRIENGLIEARCR